MYETMNSEKDESSKRHNAAQIQVNKSSFRQNAYMEEALDLLQKWQLSELQETFAAHEVSIRSFQYLTDVDINELIPKIGLRTIFRAMLNEWRLNNGQHVQNVADSCYATNKRKRKRSFVETFAGYDHTNNNILEGHMMEPTTVLKTEPTETDEDETVSAWLETPQDNNSDLLTPTNFMQEEQQEQLEEEQQEVEEEQEQQALQFTQNFWKKGLNVQIKTKALLPAKEAEKDKEYDGEPLIVLELITNSIEGRMAIEFYKQNGFLDLKNRKRIVHVLITAVVERKINKYTAIFHDMTVQLLEIFPNEKYETYFVPHHGPHPARGALYYKYSNYTRKLRRDGLLAYKIHKPAYR